MQQTEDNEITVEGFTRNDGRVYFYDPDGSVEAWIDAHERDFVEVTP